MRKIALVLAVASSVEAFSLFSHSKPAPAAGLRRSRNPVANLMEELFGASKGFAAPVVMGTEEMMSQKEFGTSAVPVQKELRWNCDVETADRICNYNRHYAEYGGYWERATSFLKEESEASGELTFYDSNTGKPLFYGPRDRSWDQFVKESKVHGWPSFRDSEVNWDFVRVLPNGECISVDGTHLGHNLPDGTGNRYCINLVSVAGKPLK
jgi:peptide methionine sulfoxide reductase MsrB